MGAASARARLPDDGAGCGWALKTFRVSDRRSVQFRTELFNAFNHPNFGPPNIQPESSGFGQILSAGNGRIVQFGLKFYF
jgi:hypothetical protein